jgi:hypothetical protein
MKNAVEENSGKSSNESYCQRLLAMAFPTEIWIEDVSYDQDQLKAALMLYEDLLALLVARCFIKPEMPAKPTDAQREWYCTQVLSSIFPKAWNFGDRHYLKEDLYEALLVSPKLQQDVAARRYYMPSKWLVEQERIARRGPEWRGDIYDAVAKEQLIGLCFSGGGIRSATFNLGVIQGLAQMGLLPHVDYLSSVSGGGYIHEFLAGWILRNGDQHSVVRELIPQAEPGCLPRAPEPIQWLKRYASYLTPTRGLVSTDTWTMMAIWFRNTVMNQIPLVASFGVALFAVHLLIPIAIEGKPEIMSNVPWLWWITGLVLLALAITSLAKLWINLDRQEARARDGDASECKDLLDNTSVVGWIILPWLACATWLTYWVQTHPGTLTGCAAWPVILVWTMIAVLVQFVIFKGGALGAFQFYHPRGHKGATAALYAFAGLVSTAIACGIGWLMVWGCNSLSGWLVTTIGAIGAVSHQSEQALQFSVSGVAEHFHASLDGALQAAAKQSGGVPVDSWRLKLTLLPGVLLSVPYVAIELTLGLLGRDYRDMQREWLARLRAWSVLYAFLWVGVIGIVLLGPYLGYWLGAQTTTLRWSAAITFLVSHLTTMLAGASGNGDGKPTDKGFLGYKPTDIVALLAAPVACVGLLLLLSFLASKSVDTLTRLFSTCPLAAWMPEWQFVVVDLALLAIMLLIAYVMGRRVDINEFSMHIFYKNRLSRCYLGAVRPGRRTPDPFTGFDATSTIRIKKGPGVVETHHNPPFVTELLPCNYTRLVEDPKLDAQQGNYDGPFPIFCTTLNLTTGEDLATQERKGTSFAFTPLYSGYTVGWTDGAEHRKISFNGYVPTDTYAYPKDRHNPRGGIHVDSAVAISGAAANPNMGYNSNPALAFLMTLFNVRLGWWISNPRRMDKWEAKKARATPRFALFHLLLELFGAVGDDAAYVNLSDGGHFENMGLYELVRRRCKFIIVSDAEADTDMNFGGMGMAITKCRADFGAEIDLDLRPLRKNPETGYSKAHCVVGTIQYPPPWAGGMNNDPVRTSCECGKDGLDDPYTGVIVYMKSSLVGDEPADLLAYQLKSPAFPQDSTANQWFTESMFEAYRRLGHHVAMATIQPALPPDKSRIKADDKNATPRLFERMYSIWYPPTPEMDKYLSDHMKQYQTILGEMRQRAELSGLEAALNDVRSDSDLLLALHLPVPWASPATVAGADLYATQFANTIIDFMYTVYTDLLLAFPDNRTSPHAKWLICLFRRWCRVILLQKTWETHIPTYPIEFRLFARRELGLPPVKDFIE